MKRVESFFTEAVQYRESLKNDMGTQTDEASQNNDNRFSRTGDVRNTPTGKAKKEIDLLQRGFYMRSYSGRNGKRERYMGEALERGKLGGLNKSSMK